MNNFSDYLDHGWALTPLSPGTKKPVLRNWARPEKAIRGLENTRVLNKSAAGLLLAHCTPPLMTLDIDDFLEATAYLENRGIDLAQLIQRDETVQINSGRPNRAKLLYHMDRTRVTRKNWSG